MDKKKLYNKIMNSVSKHVKNVLNEGMSLEISNIKNTIYDFDYVFDDFEQIPDTERKRQYMMSLSSFAKGFPYDHKISFINETYYINEVATKTYDVKYTINEMKTLFGFEDWQLKGYFNPGIQVKLMVIIGNIYDNKESLIKAMESYGWSFAFESLKKIINNGIEEQWIMLHFDPMFQKSVNDEISLHPILFHWTPEYNIENIKKEGLIPKSDNYIFKYPPKIHLMKGTISNSEKLKFGRILCIANKDPRNNKNYILIDIDTRKIPYHIDYFYDPRYKYGYYTKDKICKEPLIKFNLFNF